MPNVTGKAGGKLGGHKLRGHKVRTPVVGGHKVRRPTKKTPVVGGHKVRRPKKKAAPVTRVTEAKKVIKQAAEAAERAHGDVSRNRSTRTRAAYKVKADALDRVAVILEG